MSNVLYTVTAYCEFAGHGGVETRDSGRSWQPNGHVRSNLVIASDFDAERTRLVSVDQRLEFCEMRILPRTRSTAGRVAPANSDWGREPEVARRCTP